MVFWFFFRKTYIVVIVSYSMNKTTIQISGETLERLKSFKQHEKDSYDVVLNILLDDAEDDFLSDEEIGELQLALEQVKQGKVKPIEQVAKELGVRLK